MTEQQNDLVLHEVEFVKDIIQVVERAGKFYVAMKPLCRSMGLKWNAQYELIQRDMILSQVVRMIRMTSVGKDGKTYATEMICLPLEYLNGWLFKVDISRYRGEVRQHLISYQQKCYLVLFDHFHGQARLYRVVREMQVTCGMIIDRVDRISVKLDAVESSLRSLTEARPVSEENPLADFVRKNCDFGAEYTAYKYDLYDRYAEYCAEKDIPPLSYNFFFRKLYEHSKSLKPATRRVGGRPMPCVTGIMLKWLKS